MKKQLSKILIILLGSIIIAGIVGLFFMLIHNTPEQPTTHNPSGKTPSARQPTITMKNITLHEYETKRDYEFVLTAQEGTFHHTSNKVECSNFSCNVLQHGSYVAQVNAQKSLIDQLHKQVLFQGQVTGTWKDLNIEGSDIVYSFTNQIMKTDKTMTYTHPQFNFSANQSSVNIAAQTIHMTHGVRAEFFCKDY